ERLAKTIGLPDVRECLNVADDDIHQLLRVATDGTGCIPEMRTVSRVGGSDVAELERGRWRCVLPTIQLLDSDGRVDRSDKCRDRVVRCLLQERRRVLLQVPLHHPEILATGAGERHDDATHMRPLLAEFDMRERSLEKECRQTRDDTPHVVELNAEPVGVVDRDRFVPNVIYDAAQEVRGGWRIRLERLCDKWNEPNRAESVGRWIRGARFERPEQECASGGADVQPRFGTRRGRLVDLVKNESEIPGKGRRGQLGKTYADLSPYFGAG